MHVARLLIPAEKFLPLPEISLGEVNTFYHHVKIKYVSTIFRSNPEAANPIGCVVYFLYV